MNRRDFLTGFTAARCAPAIIRTPGLLMPVKSVRVQSFEDYFTEFRVIPPYGPSSPVFSLTPGSINYAEYASSPAMDMLTQFSEMERRLILWGDLTTEPAQLSGGRA